MNLTVIITRKRGITLVPNVIFTYLTFDLEDDFNHQVVAEMDYSVKITS